MVPGIKFTVELPEEQENGMVPILDVQARMIRERLGEDSDGDTLYQGRLKYNFFKKPQQIGF